MEKKYVVEGADIHCRFGWTAAKRQLYPSGDYRVRLGGRIITTEADIESSCLCGGFAFCTSPAVDTGMATMMHQSVSSLHQMAMMGGLMTTGEDGEAKAVTQDCNFVPAFHWQNAHSRVEVYGCRALLEDSWTVCSHGMGIISIDSCGQQDENPVTQIQENLAELMAEVDRYMKENGIDEKYRDALLERVLLWNGYYNLPWDYEGNEMTRAFCAYLEQKNPALFNYFERGLYLPDGDSQIDVTYMLGMYKAREQGEFLTSHVYQETVQDDGMLNGYLEAYQMEDGKSSA